MHLPNLNSAIPEKGFLFITLITSDSIILLNKFSPGFLRLVNVLVAFNGQERKSFLQFATGCSSLPPGGLANLHPRLTIVKKVDARSLLILLFKCDNCNYLFIYLFIYLFVFNSENSFPSINTCAHYLKLPNYETEEIMRERLLAATKEKGFHLN